jgi:hypothetical protein
VTAVTEDRPKPAGRMELDGTNQQKLVFLNTHWGRQYSFAPPDVPGGQWTGTAKFGQHDRIHEWSAAELLEEVRDHYRVNGTRGSAQ